MTTTRATLRHTSFTGDPRRDATFSAENARDANTALAQRVTGRLVGPVEYVVTSDDTVPIALLLDRAPQAVFPVRVQQVTTTDARVYAWPPLDFVWDGRTSTANVFPPPGLTADERYLLTFLVLE